ncbi:hypothetical protein TSUD_299610 [Trifolium subterraneum]|uniref:Retrotransposon gag domain-containing protein n=1 Tax=Trifolium subterraneum TaxID=3900 RepID=A0A2Z6PAV8_TRISU|nr:hypothetical protein TSUD_299610 [Trifolium subterraneum]
MLRSRSDVLPRLTFWQEVMIRLGMERSAWRGEGGVVITWEMFKREFFNKYFPADVKNKKVVEFKKLEQGNVSVAEYAAKFDSLTFPLEQFEYERKYPDGRIVKARFKDGVEEFITYTMSQDIVKRERGIRCPFVKCMCGSIESPQDVIYHLDKFGFMNDYYVWKHHGERVPANINIEFDVNTDASSSGAQAECGNFGRMQEMVGDTLGVNMSYEGGNEEEIIPNDKALKFYAMMEEVNKPLFEGASDPKLSMCVRLLAAKANWNAAEDCLEFFSKMMLDATPVKDNLPTSYYDARASATPYSCWPVIVTPYNLPPDTCMTKPYMFLSCIIPGPSNPTDGIDVSLPPAAQAEIQRLTQEVQAQREEIDRLAEQDQERQQMMQQQDQERQQMMQQEIRRAMEEQTRAMEEQRREFSTLREMLASSRNAPLAKLVLMRTQLILIMRTQTQINTEVKYLKNCVSRKNKPAGSIFKHKNVKSFLENYDMISHPF